MTVAQEAIDDDAADAVLRAEVDEALIIVEKALGRLLERVENADFLLADLRELQLVE